MPTIQEIIKSIETIAPPVYQESYDNAGLITGNASAECSGALLALDSTEQVIEEAIEKNCNLVIAHHPIIFKGLKSITGKNYVERTIIKAIKNDIAIYACHTNMDNVAQGVNSKICEKIGLTNQRVLLPKLSTLLHLITFVPAEQLSEVSTALFNAGAGNIGNYDYCSFTVEGKGSFRGNESSNPTVGKKSNLEIEEEIRLEVILPKHKKSAVLQALKQTHPYEEVAYYLQETVNQNQEIGSGLIGELPEQTNAYDFLTSLKEKMNTALIRYTDTDCVEKIKTVAVCGGVGSFLLPHAIAAGADVFVTADYKYHEFFDADGNIIIADIGHFESEQFTNEIFAEVINKNFTTFAVHFSTINTNPINYL